MMTTKTMDVHEAQRHFEELIKLVANGTEVLLTNHELPFARVVPTAGTQSIMERTPGLNRGAFVIDDDFDAALPEAFWLGEE
jgi:prevent-host-death family protein